MNAAQDTGASPARPNRPTVQGVPNDGAHLKQPEATGALAATLILVDTQATAKAIPVRIPTTVPLAVHAVHVDEEPAQTSPAIPRLGQVVRLPAARLMPVAGPTATAVQAVEVPACIAFPAVKAAGPARQETPRIAGVLPALRPPAAAVKPPTIP